MSMPWSLAFEDEEYRLAFWANGRQPSSTLKWGGAGKPILGPGRLSDKSGVYVGLYNLTWVSESESQSLSYSWIVANSEVTGS